MMAPYDFTNGTVYIKKTYRCNTTCTSCEKDVDKAAKTILFVLSLVAQKNSRPAAMSSTY